jgi:hypothetical protein
MSSGVPNLANFQIFTQNVAGISQAYLPLTSPQYQHAFDQATNIVLKDLAQARSAPTSYSIIELATYNLGVHLIIEFAIDQSFPVSAAAWAAGLVTITTPTINTVQVGDRIAVSGISPYAYDNAPIDPGSQVAAFVVNSVINMTNFNYPLSPNPGTAILAANAAVSELYFTIARARLKINEFAPGIITSTSDLTTSAGLLNPKFMQALTLENLQLLKTSWGRAYMSIAQKYGPTIWGLTS